MLNWRTVTPSSSPRFLVKGTEIACALAGQFSRFQIVEVRTREADGYAGTAYSVRDADTVTDAQVKDGMRPKPVFFSSSLDEAVAFCERYRIPEEI